MTISKDEEILRNTSKSSFGMSWCSDVGVSSVASKVAAAAGRLTGWPLLEAIALEALALEVTLRELDSRCAQKYRQWVLNQALKATCLTPKVMAHMLKISCHLYACVVFYFAPQHKMAVWMAVLVGVSARQVGRKLARGDALEPAHGFLVAIACATSFSARPLTVYIAREHHRLQVCASTAKLRSSPSAPKTDLCVVATLEIARHLSLLLGDNLLELGRLYHLRLHVLRDHSSELINCQKRHQLVSLKAFGTRRTRRRSGAVVMCVSRSRAS